MPIEIDRYYVPIDFEAFEVRHVIGCYGYVLRNLKLVKFWMQHIARAVIYRYVCDFDCQFVYYTPSSIEYLLQKEIANESKTECSIDFQMFTLDDVRCLKKREREWENCGTK